MVLVRVLINLVEPVAPVVLVVEVLLLEMVILLQFHRHKVIMVEIVLLVLRVIMGQVVEVHTVQ